MTARRKSGRAEGTLVCLGVIAAAHGVRGHVKVKTFTDEPSGLTAYGPLTDEAGARTFELTVVGPCKGGIVARVAGVKDRDAAEALKGIGLYIERAALPEPGADEYYHGDLIGLAVTREDGAALGRVKAVHDFGAGDILEIELPDGRTVLVPFTRDAAPEVDLARGRIVMAGAGELIEELVS